MFKGNSMNIFELSRDGNIGNVIPTPHEMMNKMTIPVIVLGKMGKNMYMRVIPTPLTDNRALINVVTGLTRKKNVRLNPGGDTTKGCLLVCRLHPGKGNGPLEFETINGVTKVSSGVNEYTTEYLIEFEEGGRLSIVDDDMQHRLTCTNGKLKMVIVPYEEHEDYNSYTYGTLSYCTEDE